MGFTHADTAIAQATSSVSTQSVTLSGAVSAGDVVCLVWASPNPDADTVSDTAGNTWTTPGPGANFNKFAYSVITNAAAGGITITATGGGSGTRFMVADRFTVSGGTAVFGSAVSHAISGTSGNMGSLTSVPAGELLWGALASSNASSTFTAGSSNSVSAVIGSQVGNTGGSGFSQYILSGAGGTESMSWTSTVSLTGRGAWEAYFTIAAGVAQPYPFTPPGRLSPMALGTPLIAPSPAPQSPPSGQAVPLPLTPPGLQSPMALGTPLIAPSPAPQAPPSGQAVSPPLAPPGRLSPMALAFAMLPGTAQAAPVPPPPPQPALAPLTPPGLQSPMTVAVPLTAPSPAPQSPPSGQAVPLPLTPPGLQSPMALGTPLIAPSPAPQTPPAVIPPPSPAAGTGPLTPPGRLSPMALAVPLTAPSPAPQSPVPRPYTGRYQVLIAWNSEPFAVPAWTDVTPWVRLDRSLSMQRGRQDNIAVIPAGRITLTADNSDGRFTAGRSSSPWAPGVKIGRRIQVNIPDEGGVLHTRFDGLITELPAQWEGGPGLENLAVIQAADILAWIARQPNLLSWTQQEMLADSPVALWSLADSSNGTQATDQAGQGAAPLKVVSQGDGTGAAASGSGVPLTEVQTSNIVAQQQVTTVFTFTAPGPFSWQAPPGTLVKCDVACVAGGQAGFTGSGTAPVLGGAGGSGAEYAEEPNLAVTPGNTYPGTVGAVGVPSGGLGGNTTFTGDSVTVTAHASGSGSVNTVHHPGGAGGAAGFTVGSGGGSSGGQYQAGNQASGSSPATGGTAVTGGGAGGTGDSAGTGGSPGSAPGGGGGGGLGAGVAGASGGAGQVTITARLTQSTLLMLGNPRGQNAIAVWVTSGNHLQLASTSGYGTRSPTWTTIDAGQVPSGPFHVAVDVSASVATLRVNNVSAGTLTLPAGATYTQVTIGGAYGAWLGGWNGSAGLAAVYPAPLGATRTGVHWTAGTTGFAGSSTGTMISKIASYIGLPSFWYTPPSGPSDPSYGLTLASYYNLNGQQPLAAAQLYETAEAGVLYVNAAGQLVFADRASRYAAGSASSPAFVLSAGQYEPDTHFKVNDQYLLTAACYATSHIPGGYPVAAAAAKLDYGPYIQNAGSPGSPQSAPFADATGTANAYSADDIMDAGWWQVNANGQPVPRVPSLTVDLLTQPASEFSTASFYGTDIGSALQLAGLPSQAPDNAGQPLSAYHVIEGINETLSLTAHTVQLYTSPLAQNAAWIAGDSLLGVIGTTDAIGRSQAPAALGPPYGAPPTFGPALNRTGSVGAQDMRTLTVNTQNRLTPPLAIAQQQAAQTLTTLAGQAVTFDTLLADTAGGFGNLTTYTVQPGYAGNYLCLAVVQAATGISNLGGLAAWFSATLAGSGSIATTTGSANAPAAFTILASVAIPAGTYTVNWSVTLSGTTGASEVNNFLLALPGLAGISSVNGSAAGTYPQAPVTFTTTGGTAFLQTGGNAGTAGSAYSETLTGPPAASQWGAKAVPYLSSAPYTAIALAQRIGPCAAGDTIQVVTAASYTTPPASVPLGTADGGSMFALIWQGN